jgi:ribonuclease Z
VQSWIAGRTVPLNIYGPPKPVHFTPPKDASGEAFGTLGTEDVVKEFALAYNSDAAFRIVHHGEDYMPAEGAPLIGHDIAKMGTEESVIVYDQDGLKISAFLVSHNPADPAYGYRIDYGSRSVVVSGDTVKVQNMVRVAKGADVLVHEGLSPAMVEMLAAALDQDGHQRQAKITRDTINYHTSPVDAAGIADEAGVPLLVFTHIVPALPNALMRHMFLRDMAAARGSGDTIHRQGWAVDHATEGLDGDSDQAIVLEEDVDARVKPGNDGGESAERKSDVSYPGMSGACASGLDA